MLRSFAILIVALYGCQAATTKPAASDFLAGTVRLDGKLLNYGTVAFHPTNGQPLKAVIQTDGTYRVRKPPVGEVKVVVETGPAPRGIGTPGGGGAAPIVLETINVPAKYGSPATTDLKYTVTAEGSEYHIEMKSTPRPDKP